MDKKTKKKIFTQKNLKLAVFLYLAVLKYRLTDIIKPTKFYFYISLFTCTSYFTVAKKVFQLLK